MADQGTWWKLWTSALDDPDLDNLGVEDFGRYCKLGAFVKRHGTAGRLVVAAPARVLCAAFQVADFRELLAVFHRLPHVTTNGVSPETVNAVSSETIATVSFDNWLKYQGDLSTERVRKFRFTKRLKTHTMKRYRREEKAEEKAEEKKVLSPTSLTVDPFSDETVASVTLPREPTAEPTIAPSFWAQITQALDDCPTLGQAPRLREMGYWAALLGAHDVDPVAEIRKAHAWIKANPRRAPKRDLGRFMLAWARRAAEE